MKIHLGKTSGTDYEVIYQNNLFVLKLKSQININYRETYSFRDTFKLMLPAEGVLLFSSHNDLLRMQGCLSPNTLVLTWTPEPQDIRISIANTGKDPIYLKPGLTLAVGVPLKTEEVEVVLLSEDSPREIVVPSRPKERNRITSTIVKG